MVARGVKWKVVTRARKVEDFAAPTEVVKSVECLDAQREPNVLVYATYMGGSAVVSQKAARRKTAATATASRTEEADGARLMGAAARFVRVITVRCTKFQQTTLRFR